jgi:hypothetical protein
MIVLKLMIIVVIISGVMGVLGETIYILSQIKNNK